MNTDIRKPKPMNLRIILEKNVLLYAKAKANKHIKKENKIKKSLWSLSPQVQSLLNTKAS